MCYIDWTRPYWMDAGHAQGKPFGGIGVRTEPIVLPDSAKVKDPAALLHSLGAKRIDAQTATSPGQTRGRPGPHAA